MAAFIYLFLGVLAGSLLTGVVITGWALAAILWELFHKR